MKRSVMYLLSGAVFLSSSIALANNPAETVGVQAPITANDMSQSIVGWSAKRQILGKTVFNEKNEKVGVIDDIVITSDKQVSYAVVGAGGFLGVAKHDVAIPISRFQQNGEKFTVTGLTKDKLQKVPEFKYTVAQ